jgi:membrane protein implicated in regulation of membrane protease activity
LRRPGAQGNVDAVSPWQLWLIGAVLLLVLEMFAPSGFFLTCVAIGALVGAVVALLPVGFTIQALAFAGVTLASAILVRPFLLARLRLTGGEVRTNVAALIGKTGVVTERIDPIARRGRVLVDGEDWRGATIDDTSLEPGTRITVVQVEGTTLKVDREG